VVSAYENLHHSLLVGPTPIHKNQGARPGQTGGIRSPGLSVSVKLQRGSPKATRMTVLRGVIPVSILTSEREVILAEKVLQAQGKTTEVEGMEFTFNQVSRGNNQLRVRLAVTSKTRDLSTLHYLYRRVALYDNRGEKIRWQSASSYTSTRSAGTNLTFALPGGAKPATPTKFVFLHWQTRRCLIPFEFRDVPLP
jgi:hypothetical protein